MEQLERKLIRLQEEVANLKARLDRISPEQDSGSPQQAREEATGYQG